MSLQEIIDAIKAGKPELQSIESIVAAIEPFVALIPGAAPVVAAVNVAEKVVNEAVDVVTDVVSNPQSDPATLAASSIANVPTTPDEIAARIVAVEQDIFAIKAIVNAVAKQFGLGTL